ncbi:cysteine proteinase [Mycena vulgaris]|nr:cysteine proteinase [Mycena vulgaris]
MDAVRNTKDPETPADAPNEVLPSGGIRNPVELSVDLVGGLFAVIESDPGVFTSLARRVGIRGLELVELFDIEPDAIVHLNPRGLGPRCGVRVVCEPSQRRSSSKRPEIEHRAVLGAFKRDTEEMSSVMKGLAISSSAFIREAHRSLARHATAAKRASSSKSKQKKEEPVLEASEAYHFIGYVPAYGKVWELDGLKSGLLEVGELVGDSPDAPQKDWKDVVRPAIRSKMRKYGGDAESGDSIRFSLLALVDGLYEKASDAFEFFRHESMKTIFDYRAGSAEAQRTYSADFGARRMARDMESLGMTESELVSAWEKCVREAASARISLEDEVAKAMRNNEFIGYLEKEGLLDTILDGDGGAKKKGKHAKVR